MTDHPSNPKHAPHIEDTTAALLHALPDPALLIASDGTILAINDAGATGKTIWIKRVAGLVRIVVGIYLINLRYAPLGTFF